MSISRPAVFNTRLRVQTASPDVRASSWRLPTRRLATVVTKKPSLSFEKEKVASGSTNPRGLSAALQTVPSVNEEVSLVNGWHQYA